MTTIKRKRPTIETIRASSSVPEEVKIQLEECPVQPIRSLELTEWAREVIRKGRKLKHTDEEIAEWIKTYARSSRGNWSKAQITVLLDDEF